MRLESTAAQEGLKKQQVIRQFAQLWHARRRRIFSRCVQMLKIMKAQAQAKRRLREAVAAAAACAAARDLQRAAVDAHALTHATQPAAIQHVGGMQQQLGAGAPRLSSPPPDHLETARKEAADALATFTHANLTAVRVPEATRRSGGQSATVAAQRLRAAQDAVDVAAAAVQSQHFQMQQHMDALRQAQQFVHTSTAKEQAAQKQVQYSTTRLANDQRKLQQASIGLGTATTAVGLAQSVCVSDPPILTALQQAEKVAHANAVASAATLAECRGLESRQAAFVAWHGSVRRRRTLYSKRVQSADDWERPSGAVRARASTVSQPTPNASFAIEIGQNAEHRELRAMGADADLPVLSVSYPDSDPHLQRSTFPTVAFQTSQPDRRFFVKFASALSRAETEGRQILESAFDGGGSTGSYMASIKVRNSAAPSIYHMIIRAMPGCVLL